jgi:ribonuclease HI
VRKEITDQLGFLSTDDLGKYLGVPIIHSRSNRGKYQYILDKVNQRLSNWKTINLSLAGRVTLAKSVIQALPSYVMQTTVIPRSLCDEIDKKCRGFIWGYSPNHRHVHLASWTSICTPKSFGGLGLRSSRDMNTAAMMKVGWSLSKKKDALWVKIVRAKYKCGLDLMPRIQVSKPGSNLWRGLCKNWDKVSQNLIWRVGKGRDINFWRDHWVPNAGTLESHALVPIPHDASGESVSNFANNNGSWLLQKFDKMLPHNIIDSIKYVLAPNFDAPEDSLAWNGTPDGEFSIAAAYDSLHDHHPPLHNMLFTCIWKWQGPERIKFLLWKVARGILLTNLARKTKGMTTTDLCHICNLEPESILHTLRDCTLAKETWMKLLDTTIQYFFTTNDLQNWMYENLSKRIQGNWNIVFAVTIDTLWCARNNYIFNNIIPSTITSLRRIYAMTANIKEAWSSLNLRIPKASKNSSVMPVTCWNPPPVGSAKINTDGAVKNMGMSAACGGLARDASGKFMWGFSTNLGACFVVQAELWGILHSLEIAITREMLHIIIETDSLLAVKLINQGCSNSHTCFTLISKITNLLSKLPMANIQHIGREANAAADLLAKNGFNCNNANVLYLAPNFLVNSIVRDAYLIPPIEGLI